MNDMTAEIFLAQFLATICAFIVMSVFWRTVWTPIAAYLMKRALARLQPDMTSTMDQARAARDAVLAQEREGAFTSPGSSTHAIPADLAEHMKSYCLGEQLQVAALEMPEASPYVDRGPAITRLLEAADDFRRGTPEQKRRQIRAMAAHTKIMQGGNDSSGRGAA
jgi:hypothetical protein